ncbi:hypothetical protein [Microbacterium paulum]
MTKPQTWTDERTGRSFLVHKTRDETGKTFRLERNTDTHETLGYVRVEKEDGASRPRIWAVASTLLDGKAEREYVTAVEDGFKVLTSGA